MDFVNLIGAEDVRRAASEIGSAAESMRNTAGHMDDALRSALNRFEELVQRLEALATAQAKAEGDHLVRLCPACSTIHRYGDACAKAEATGPGGE